MRKDDGCRELPVKEMTAEEKKAAEEATERFVKLVFHTSQAEAEEMFNCGIFNEIAIGYGKLALDRMGITLFDEFEEAMKKALDMHDAKEARKVYLRKGV
ncbi:MAG: hypothetical protein IJD33_02005 [Clostridia bacterium]|nr:hypothetical protein [Clostridia bacterium]